MRRRHFLTLCAGSLAAISGCQFRDRSASTDEGRPRSADTVGETPSNAAGNASGGTAATATGSGTRRGADASITVASLRPDALIHYTDVVGIDGSDRSQYLFLDVSVTAGDPPPRAAFRLRFDGSAASPLFPDRQLWRFLQGSVDPYDGESGAGRMAFELPDPVGADDLTVTWPGDERRLTDETLPPAIRRRLAVPSPSLSLDASIPGEVATSTDPTLSFTATNEGDVPTYFVAGVNRRGPEISYAPIIGVSEPVPPGGTETVEITDSISLGRREQGTGDGEPNMTYVVKWAGDTVRRDVRLTA